MLTFAHPVLFVLVLLPLLMRFLPAHREQRAALRVPFFGELVDKAGAAPAPGAVILSRNLGQRVLLPLCWLLLVAAMARPQWVEEPISRIDSARDLMLAVDLSGSMSTEDFVAADGSRTDRLTAVKSVLDDFIARREGDRLGLIVFGNAAFLQVPFTLDHDTYRTLLDEMQIGMAGPQTMIGEAIGLGIKGFEASEAKQRVMILLTDGNDTGSRVPPGKAAEIAAAESVRIYTIGVGDPAAAGEAPLDEATLGRIAETTGGRFYRANDRESLAAVYQELDELEPLDFESESYRPKRELFHWPLAAFLLLGLGYHLVMAGAGLRRRREPIAT